jgi:hypothetical protein
MILTVVTKIVRKVESHIYSYIGNNYIYNCQYNTSYLQILPSSKCLELFLPINDITKKKNNNK